MDPRELEVISAVCMTDSPYVVRVFTYWVETDPRFDKYCILMELCETNLASYIYKRYVEDKSYFTEQEIWEIICNVMEGIQKCHDLSFTHRDLKPQNSIRSLQRKKTNV
jgi:serine/threonine protein kinase